MARPTKYTPERINLILDGIRNGMTEPAAASRAGIHRTELWRWKQRYSTFCNQVEIAKDEAESRFTAIVAAAAKPHDVVETRTVHGPNGTTTTTVTRKEMDGKLAIEWLKRQRKENGWGDQIDVKKIDDDTLVRLLLSDTADRKEEEVDFPVEV